MNFENNYLKGSHNQEAGNYQLIYPEKLTFDDFAVRTARLNEAVRLIYSRGAGSSENKKRTKRENSRLSCGVTAIGFKPITF